MLMTPYSGTSLSLTVTEDEVCTSSITAFNISLPFFASGSQVAHQDGNQDPFVLPVLLISLSILSALNPVSLMDFLGKRHLPRSFLLVLLLKILTYSALSHSEGPNSLRIRVHLLFFLLVLAVFFDQKARSYRSAGSLVQGDSFTLSRPYVLPL